MPFIEKSCGLARKPIRGKCLVAWKTACGPTELGGLGITNLRLAGLALQTCWLWLHKIDNGRAWSSLPLNMDSEVHAFFRASTFTELGDRNDTLFWDDRWIKGRMPSDIVSNLVKLVCTQLGRGLTTGSGLEGSPAA